MCNIGEHVRTVVVDPIQVPAPLPGQEPQIEPSYAEPVFCIRCGDRPSVTEIEGRPVCDECYDPQSGLTTVEFIAKS
jgi:hypothetical protein